eukprot:TRINITY_DN74029_c0_g1_i1.p1 TRINITY_DN74029_c0_g1~~TRINITY_DN74029_c0_g1_i1.p1  ORF type:complete len:1052 (-),score=169.81 TRINITY_DN74029_c0_g1_i1:121-3219(-)
MAEYDDLGCNPIDGPTAASGGQILFQTGVVGTQKSPEIAISQMCMSSADCGTPRSTRDDDSDQEFPLSARTRSPVTANGEEGQSFDWVMRHRQAGTSNGVAALSSVVSADETNSGLSPHRGLDDCQTHAQGDHHSPPLPVPPPQPPPPPPPRPPTIAHHGQMSDFEEEETLPLPPPPPAFALDGAGGVNRSDEVRDERGKGGDAARDVHGQREFDARESDAPGRLDFLDGQLAESHMASDDRRRGVGGGPALGLPTNCEDDTEVFADDSTSTIAPSMSEGDHCWDSVTTMGRPSADDSAEASATTSRRTAQSENHSPEAIREAIQQRDAMLAERQAMIDRQDATIAKLRAEVDSFQHRTADRCSSSGSVCGTGVVASRAARAEVVHESRRSTGPLPGERTLEMSLKARRSAVAEAVRRRAGNDGAATASSSAGLASAASRRPGRGGMRSPVASAEILSASSFGSVSEQSSVAKNGEGVILTEDQRRSRLIADIHSTVRSIKASDVERTALERSSPRLKREVPWPAPQKPVQSSPNLSSGAAARNAAAGGTLGSMSRHRAVSPQHQQTSTHQHHQGVVGGAVGKKEVNEVVVISAVGVARSSSPTSAAAAASAATASLRHSGRLPVVPEMPSHVEDPPPKQRSVGNSTPTSGSARPSFGRPSTAEAGVSRRGYWRSQSPGASAENPCPSSRDMRVNSKARATSPRESIQSAKDEQTEAAQTHREQRVVGGSLTPSTGCDASPPSGACPPALDMVAQTMRAPPRLPDVVGSSGCGGVAISHSSRSLPVEVLTTASPVVALSTPPPPRDLPSSALALGQCGSGGVSGGHVVIGGCSGSPVRGVNAGYGVRGGSGGYVVGGSTGGCVSGNCSGSSTPVAACAPGGSCIQYKSPRLALPVGGFSGGRVGSTACVSNTGCGSPGTPAASAATVAAIAAAAGVPVDMANQCRSPRSASSTPLYGGATPTLHSVRSMPSLEKKLLLEGVPQPATIVTHKAFVPSASGTPVGTPGRPPEGFRVVWSDIGCHTPRSAAQLQR